MPVDRTLNDESLAAEEAFVAAQIAKDAPKEVPKEPEPARQAEVTPVPTPAKEVPPDDPTVTTPAESADGAQDPNAVPTPGEGEGDESEGEVETDEDAEVTDEAFAAAMEAERASLSLDTIPQEARPLVQKKIKDLEAGFTRTMQKVRADQKDAMTVKAEMRFQREHPAEFITTLLLSNPDLMTAVNDKLGEFENSPIARGAHDVIVERAREKALAAEQEQVTKADAEAKRADDIVRMGKAAARAAGVPWEMGVEADIAAHLALHADITEAEVRTIAADKAKIWKRHLREQGRNRSQQYVEQKVRDRKTAAPAIRPASGTAPAPASRPVPTNDDEFIAQFTSKM